MVRWLKLSLVVIVGCGFLAMMIYALINREEIRSSQVEPPLIVPPAEALKRRPDQPGGMQIPNRDKLVFDLLDSNNTTLGETGVASGQPVSETAPAKAEVVSETVPAVQAVEVAEEVSVSTPAVVSKVPAIVSIAQVAKPVEVKVEPKAVEPKVEAKPEPVKTAAKPSGKWGVQLAAVNSMADGNALAAKAAKDFSSLSVATAKVVPAPGGKKYRVQFVGFKSREDAAAACAKLAGKQACFPVAP